MATVQQFYATDAPTYKREQFAPVMTEGVTRLHKRLQLLRRLVRWGLVTQAAVDRADVRTAVAYSLSNSSPWVVPERLRRYEGLVDLVQRVESWVTFRLVPAGWFEHLGDVAMSYHGENGPVIFFEDQPLHVFHTTDTILHEIVHATGVSLGRVTSSTVYSRDETPYWTEEGVAVVGAIRLAYALDLPRASNPAQMEEMSICALERAAGKQLDRAVVGARAREAVQLLVGESGL